MIGEYEKLSVGKEERPHGYPKGGDFWCFTFWSLCSRMDLPNQRRCTHHVPLP
jgi:hypothetical protein